MGIEIGGRSPRGPGETLFRALTTEINGLAFADRLALFNAFKAGHSFAQLRHDLRAAFERVAAELARGAPGQ